jgi:hypothetical protein
MVLQAMSCNDVTDGSRLYAIEIGPSTDPPWHATLNESTGTATLWQRPVMYE